MYSAAGSWDHHHGPSVVAGMAALVQPSSSEASYLAAEEAFVADSVAAVATCCYWALAASEGHASLVAEASYPDQACLHTDFHPSWGEVVGQACCFEASYVDQALTAVQAFPAGTQLNGVAAFLTGHTEAYAAVVADCLASLAYLGAAFQNSFADPDHPWHAGLTLKMQAHCANRLAACHQDLPVA